MSRKSQPACCPAGRGATGMAITMDTATATATATAVGRSTPMAGPWAIGH